MRDQDEAERRPDRHDRGEAGQEQTGQEQAGQEQAGQEQAMRDQDGAARMPDRSGRDAARRARDGRDRDQAGRARNARPRDAYGRPLPRELDGEQQIPDDYSATPTEALAEAQRLLDADRPFHAHEVLEAVWKTAPVPERDLWQGLAQLAVGLTHVRRGNARGAQALLRRAADRIDRYRPAPYGVAAAALARHARDLADRIKGHGLNAVGDADLTPRLTA